MGRLALGPAELSKADVLRLREPCSVSSSSALELFSLWVRSPTIEEERSGLSSPSSLNDTEGEGAMG